ncbi:MAG: peptidyl-prolyl cis-trans isomerase [Acidobacteriota bacterium]
MTHSSRVLVGLVPLALLVLLGACGEQPLGSNAAPRGDDDPTVVASYDDGEVHFEDVGLELRGLAWAPFAPESLPEFYYETAAKLAIEDAWGERLDPGELPDPSALFGTPSGRVLVDNYLATDDDPLTPTPEEVEDYFETQRDDMRRVAVRRIAYIYRRDRADEDAAALFADLTRQFHNGAAFSQLARDYSDSETRTIGGNVGWVQPGRLAPHVEEAVFALPPHQVSAPVAMPGGRAIFLVAEAIEAREYDFEEMEPLIYAHIYAERRFERLVALADALDAPEDALILDSEALLEAWSAPDRERQILAVGDVTLTTEELRALRPVSSVLTIPAFAPPRFDVDRLYQSVVGEALVLTVGIPADDQVIADAALVAAQRQRRLEKLNDIAHDEIRAKITEDQIRAYYDQRRHRYQSDLRVVLRSLEQPLARTASEQDVVQALRRLETARADLIAGTSDLETVANDVGARYRDHEWIDYRELASWDAKIATYLLELGTTGFSVPFQLNRRLFLFHVVERDEPEILPYEEVRDRVAADYMTENWTLLFATWRDATLETIDFHFFGRRVRERVAPETLPLLRAEESPAG